MTTYEATSGYHTDIQDAVDLASSGDTVLIPEGTHNFINVDEAWDYDITSHELVNIPPGIHVKGVTTPRTSGYAAQAYGRDLNNQSSEWLTKLIIPWAAETNKGCFFKFESDEQPDDPMCEVSDLAFYGYYDAGDTWEDQKAYRIGAVDFQYVTEFRAHHLFTQNLRGTVISCEGIYTHGLIDHCHLYNPHWTQTGPNMVDMDVGYGVGLGKVYFNRQGGHEDALRGYWNENDDEVFGCYTDASVFVEDCLFDGGFRHGVASNNGGIYVFRYNTIQNSMGFGDLDAHGWSYYGLDCPECAVTKQSHSNFVTHYQTHGYSEAQAEDYWEANKEIRWLGTRAWEDYGNWIKNSDNPYGGTLATMLRGGHSIHFNNRVGGGDYDYYLYFTNHEGDVPDTDLNGAQADFWVDESSIVLDDGCELYSGAPCEAIATTSLPEWYTAYTYPHPLNDDETLETYTSPVPPTPTNYRPFWVLCEYRHEHIDESTPQTRNGFMPYKGSPGSYKHRQLVWIDPIDYLNGRNKWWRRRSDLA